MDASSSFFIVFGCDGWVAGATATGIVVSFLDSIKVVDAVLVILVPGLEGKLFEVEFELTKMI